MESYGNKSGNSGVIAYETGSGFIRVRFTDGDTYLYTDASAGPHNIRHMKELAASGKGLATYISRYVKTGYAQKRGHEDFL